MNRNLYLKLWGAAMMQITQEDLNRYFEAQKIKTATCKLSGKRLRQNRYGLYRWKTSGLDIKKYFYIADNENKFMEKKDD